MHTRFFENEFGFPMIIETMKTSVHSIRDGPVPAIHVTFRSGINKTVFFKTTVTEEESKMLVKAFTY